MTQTADPITEPHQRELGEIIEAYNLVTERLERSHVRLTEEVARLHRQLEEKNRELARKERLAALGEMAAGVAHEVRNPLGAIQLYASMLDQDLRSLPEAQRLVRKIASAVTSLDGIVNDILAFAGHERLAIQPLALARVIEDVMGLTAPQRDALNGTIHVSEAAADAFVRADEREVTRALVNLVFNALDAAGSGGQVWLDAVDAGAGQIGIVVADDGPGIPADLRQRIFNPFFTTKDTGTGLGLSIVHRIAEAHGGRVEVGDRPDGGAAFTMVLPAAAPVWTEEEKEQA
ncbi:MAG: sensor histidine kinase [Phycisphaerae bacterium]|nr:sensor histidine kinase [Phycisphaerae bacterium]